MARFDMPRRATSSTRALSLIVPLLALALGGCNSRSTGASATPNTTPPVVALSFPVGGETISGQITMLWNTVEPNPGTVDIRLSADSGATFPLLVASGVPDIGQYGWDSSTVPGGNTYRVQVTAIDAFGNVSVPSESSGDITIDSPLLWTVTTNPTPGQDSAWFDIDGTDMYLAAIEGDQLRIEKRDLADGTLDESFGVGGVVLSSIGLGFVQASVLVDSTGVYVTAEDLGTNLLARIEKRDLSDGSLISSFGSGGVAMSVCNAGSAPFPCGTPGAVAPTSGTWGRLELAAADAAHVYLVGAHSDQGWLMEKRDKNTGALAAGPWSAGAISAGVNIEQSYLGGTAFDGSHLYLAGNLVSTGQVNKIEAGQGAPEQTFGVAGVASVMVACGSGPMPTNVDSVAIDASSAYLVVNHCDGMSPAPQVWSIQRNDIVTGLVDPSFGTAGRVEVSRTNSGDLYADTAAQYLYLVTASTIERRHLADGSLEATFGNQGVLTPSWSGPSTSYRVGASALYLAISEDLPGGVDSQVRIMALRK